METRKQVNSDRKKPFSVKPTNKHRRTQEEEKVYKASDIDFNMSKFNTSHVYERYSEDSSEKQRWNEMNEIAARINWREKFKQAVA